MEDRENESVVGRMNERKRVKREKERERER